MGKRLEVIVGEDNWLERWVFQRDKGGSMGIQYIDEEFQEVLRVL